MHHPVELRYAWQQWLNRKMTAEPEQVRLQLDIDFSVRR
jgi:hypothetical protein